MLRKQINFDTIDLANISSVSEGDSNNLTGGFFKMFKQNNSYNHSYTGTEFPKNLNSTDSCTNKGDKVFKHLMSGGNKSLNRCPDCGMSGGCSCGCGSSSMRGGATVDDEAYRAKYLKYKAKYLNIKNKH